MESSEAGGDTLCRVNGTLVHELSHGPTYLVDVLWGQPIKLIQVVSTSEFHEYWWNDLENIFLVPAAF